MHSQKTSAFSLFWLLSYISIASVSAAIITPALPEIQALYALSLSGVEWIVSAFLIGYVCGQLIYGPLANRFGRLKALRIGLIINLLGIGLCLAALAVDSYWPLVLGRLITALGAAAGLACTFMLINEWLPEAQRSTAMSYSVLSFALGVGLAVLVGGLITEYWHWQGCFWFLLAHGLIMLVGTAKFSETLKKPKPISVATIIHDYSHALRSNKLIIFSIVVGSCAVVSYCFSAAAPQIAQEFLKLSAAKYGYWNSLNIIGMLIGGFSAKILISQKDVHQVIRYGLIGMLISIVSLIVQWQLGCQSTVWFFTTTAALYLFSSYLFAGGSFIASNAIEDKASGAAMMSFVNMCFATLSVIIMGYLSTNALKGFIMILSFAWLIVVGLLLTRKPTEL